MKCNLKTKFFIASVFMMIPFAVMVVVAFYEFNSIQKTTLQVYKISKEVDYLSSLQLAISKSVMAPNDYIITGNKKYIDEYNKVEIEVDRILAKIEDEIMKLKRIYDIQTTEKSLRKEEDIFRDILNAWTGIKISSRKILNIESPQDDPEAIILMEEMDYEWGYPAMEQLGEWLEHEKDEMKGFAAKTKKMWEHGFLILLAAVLAMLVFSALMTAKLSSLFTGPLNKLIHGAHAISQGDLNQRLDIRTGDEIETLANSFNDMTERLNTYYSDLETRVMERTREIEEKSQQLHQKTDELEGKTAELESQKKELEKKISELQRFTNATIQREFRIKELKDELKRLKGVILG